MRTEDPFSYSYDHEARDNGISVNGQGLGMVWNYGKEIWCNMEGQFLYIVADLSHLSSPYEMSLCSIGI